MKYSYAFAAALVCLACVSVQAAPPAAQEEAQVLRYDSDVQPESYKFRWVSLVAETVTVSRSAKRKWKLVSLPLLLTAAHLRRRQLGYKRQSALWGGPAEERGHRPRGNRCAWLLHLCGRRWQDLHGQVCGRWEWLPARGRSLAPCRSIGTQCTAVNRRRSVMQHPYVN